MTLRKKKEYFTLRYADDTSLFKDDSLLSLDGIFQTLDFFAYISEMRINLKIIKIIWIRK